MELRGMWGGLYRLSEWIMRLSVINVLWVVCSLPFFYFLSVALFTDVKYIYQSLTLVGIISPFTVFPATAAMFAVARKWVMGDTDVPLFKTFFRGYKENYKQSMLGGIIFIVLGAVLFTNFRFYIDNTGLLRYLSYLFITLFFVLLASLFHYFSIMVHFHMKFWQIVKNCILMSIGHPISTIILLICNAVIAYVSFTKLTFLIPFFMGSIIATFSFWQFYRSVEKIKAKHEAELEKEKAEQETDADAADNEAPGEDQAAEPSPKQ